jgi:hypothetical protein
MTHKIAIDADSMVDIALSRIGKKAENWLEKSYLEFCGQIKEVHSGIFRRYRYNIGDSVEHIILLSPKKSWRNRYVSTYKSNRDPRSPEKTELLNLIWQRLGTEVKADNIAEADDWTIYYASLGWHISAIDKDIHLASPMPVFNYKTKKWTEPKSKEDIEKNIIMQSVMGDSVDGIRGAKGKGKTFCENNILNRRSIPYNEWVSWFECEQDAIESMRLVRMDQWTPDGGLQMWQPGLWIL